MTANYHDREKAYRDADGLNQSTLKLWRDGAAKGRYAELNPKPTGDRQAVGILVERMIYCPDDLRVFERMPENRGPKGENAAKNAEAEASGLVAVKPADMETAAEVAGLIRSTVDLRRFKTGVAMYATVEGVRRKCLFDFLDTDTDTALDLKVTGNELSDFWLCKQMGDLGWHMQAGWYSDIYQRVTGRKLDYKLIVASTVKPYRVEVIQPHQDDIAIGLAECEALAKYRAECIATNRFPHKPLKQVRLARYYVPFEAVERKHVNISAVLQSIADGIDAGTEPEMW